MYEPLETYLREVKAQLKGLPRAAREEEISEIRLHLSALVNESLKRGSSETDAVQSAIAQFGESQEVGRELKVAWEDRPEGWLRTFGAGICVAICNEFLIVVIAGLFNLTDFYVFRHFDSLNGSSMSMRVLLAQGIVMASSWIAPIIAGWAGQKIAPKRAVWSIILLYLTIAFVTLWQLPVPMNEHMCRAVLFSLPLACIGAWSRKWWIKKHAVRAIQQ